jgi:S1-C subfamily serine protease
VFVTSVNAEGIAEEGGVREGDMLLAVDGMDVNSFFDAGEIERLLASRIKKGCPVKLHLERGDGELDVVLRPAGQHRPE